MNKKVAAKTTAASFGAALSAMYAAPEAQAQIVPVTFEGGETSVVVPEQVAASFSSVGFPFVGIDQGSAPALLASNFFTTSNSAGSRGIYGGGAAIALVELGDVLTPGGLPSGGYLGGYAGTDPAAFFTAAGSTGTAFVAFQTADSGNVGYFQVSFQGTPDGDLGTAGDFTFIGGFFGSGGESLTVGVPEPSSAVGLSLLALGASGVRRRRQSVEATAA